MNDSNQGGRYRVPVEDEYVQSIGRATYVFSRLEWDAVYCCNKIKRGYVNSLGRKTAGHIAQDFVRYSKRPQDSALRADCEAAAAEFARLVKKRNALAHSNPGTTSEGKQRLIRDGVPLEIEKINSMADEFATHALVLNELHHERLKARNSGLGAL